MAAGFVAAAMAITWKGATMLMGITEGVPLYPQVLEYQNLWNGLFLVTVPMMGIACISMWWRKTHPVAPKTPATHYRKILKRSRADADAKETTVPANSYYVGFDENGYVYTDSTGLRSKQEIAGDFLRTAYPKKTDQEIRDDIPKVTVEKQITIADHIVSVQGIPLEVK
jgi:hypothetical protein